MGFRRRVAPLVDSRGRRLLKPEAGALRPGLGDSPAHCTCLSTIPPIIGHLAATREKNRAGVPAVLQANGSRESDRCVAPRPGWPSLTRRADGVREGALFRPHPRGPTRPPSPLESLPGSLTNGTNHPPVRATRPLNCKFKFWSGRHDSNVRPLPPHGEKGRFKPWCLNLQPSQEVSGRRCGLREN